MEYAAVIIPTLNRKKHLERCVNSLKQGKLSTKTDLYISVDYPPTEKYKVGYQDVVEYVKTITGFATVNIFYQDKNLGPGLNRKFLEDSIAEKHDKYVFTDDDNEFSANYLEYVNWGLEAFKEDESIYAICSCADFNIAENTFKADYFYASSYNPYGTGHWLHKNKKCAEYLTQKSIDKIYKSKELQNRLFDHSPMIYMCVAQDSLRRVTAMRGKNDNLTYIDIWENVYISINNMSCIKPILPKSRNWGIDGSGVHANADENVNYEPSIELDKNLFWHDDPIRLDQAGEEENEILHKNKFAISNNEKKKSKRLYVLNSIFGNKVVFGVFGSLRMCYRKFFKKNKSSEIMYG